MAHVHFKWAKKVLKGLHGFREQDPYMPVKIDQKSQTVKTIELKIMAQSDKFIPEHKLIVTTIEEMSILEPYPVVKEYLTTGIPFKTFEDYILKG